MRMTYDPTADAAYIYVAKDSDKRSVAETSVCSVPLKGTSVNVDFDSEGRILGIELLGARALLGEDLIAEADLE